MPEADNRRRGKRRGKRLKLIFDKKVNKNQAEIYIHYFCTDFLFSLSSQIKKSTKKGEKL